jgi:hypothetical protein
MPPDYNFLPGVYELVFKVLMMAIIGRFGM